MAAREGLAAEGRHLGKQEQEVALTWQGLLEALRAEAECRERLASAGEEAAEQTYKGSRQRCCQRCSFSKYIASIEEVN